jgi:hypothetical protein
MQIFGSMGGASPFRDLVIWSSSFETPPSSAEIFLRNGQAIDFTIDMLEDRLCSRRTEETQPLITGMCNVLCDIPLKERYFKLFTGELNFNEVIRQGKLIVSSQMEICLERAVKNSKTVLIRGIEARITCGDVFTNMTHDALHKTFPEFKVTVVSRLIFEDSKPDVVAYSIHSWNDDIDARVLIGIYGGGQTSDQAGGRVPVDIGLSFLN